MHGVPELSRVDLTPYWQHTLLVGAIAREVSRHHEGVSPDEAYLAGLLHDIGRLGLLVAEPGFYAAAIAGDEELPSPQVERQWLKVDHAEAGAWLIDRWRLGRSIADSARYHHQPLQRLSDADLLIRIVAFANLMAHDDPDPKTVIEAGSLCGLRLGQISELASRARAHVAAAAKQLGIDLDRTVAARGAPAAVDRLRGEVEPLLVASTLLADLPQRSDDRQRRLEDLAAAARMVFPFRDVVALGADGQQRLRCADDRAADWADFSLPAGASTRVGAALAAGRPAFLDRLRAASAGDGLSIGEDQLLRLLGSDQAVLLPVDPPSPGDPHAGAVLVASGDASMIDTLRERSGLLEAYCGRAIALGRRAAQRSAANDRTQTDLASRRSAAMRDVVHEINNPLSIIQNYLGVLDMKLEASNALDAGERAELAGDIAVLQQEVARVGRLAQSIATGTPTAEVAGLDIDGLLGDLVRLFRRQAADVGIELDARPHPAGHRPKVGRDQLEQVLVNLVKNAIEAIQTAWPEPGQRPQASHVIVSNNGVVNRDGQLVLEIGVRDNGPGMTPATLARVFGRRPESPDAGPGGRGRGLGIVQRLVAAMGGVIQCRSSAAGTSFDILLPCASAPADDAGHDTHEAR